MPAKAFTYKPVTSGSVFRIALPMTLAFMTTPLLGAVDTAVVGQFGNAALIGGIAVAALIFDFFMSTLNFLRSGTTGLTAQALGAGDRHAMAVTLLRALVLATMLGLAMIVLAGPILSLSLAFIAPSDAVAAAATRYFDIRILSAPLALANYAILGWMLGLSRAGLALSLQILLNGINIILSIWLGLHLGWGIEGVAWGTFIGEAVAAAVGIVICLAIGRQGFVDVWRDLLEPTGFRRMLAVNRDIMIRSFALLSAYAVFSRVGAGFGDDTLAANAVLMHVLMISSYCLDGMANAAEQLAGQSIGAKKADDFHAAVRLTFLWGLVLAALSSVIFLVIGNDMVALLTTAPAVRELAAAFLPWAALSPVTGLLAFQMDGVYIGATWSRDMRNYMLIAFAGYLALVILSVPLLGNHGLWLALTGFFLIRGGTLALAYPGLAARSFPPSIAERQTS